MTVSIDINNQDRSPFHSQTEHLLRRNFCALSISDRDKDETLNIVISLNRAQGLNEIIKYPKEPAQAAAEFVLLPFENYLRLNGSMTPTVCSVTTA